LINVTTSTINKSFALPVKGSIIVDFGAQLTGFEAFAHTESTNGKYKNGTYIKLKENGQARGVINVPVDNEGTTYDVKLVCTRYR